VKPVTTPVTATGTATSRAITPNETVSAQLNALLAEDSSYLQSARNKGLEHANQRGLLNTGLAAGTSERAAIDAAAPIAAQDSSTYAASGLSAQTANQDLNNSSIISAQNAAQTQALQTQQAADTYKLQTDLKQMDVNVDLTKLSQSDRQAFAAAVSPIMQQVQAEISNIQRMPDSELDAAGKLAAIQTQTEFLKTNISPIAQIYGYALTWEDTDLSGMQANVAAENVAAEKVAAEEAAANKASQQQGWAN
jgi:hypothetical protein